MHKKILCIGANIDDTDIKAFEIAQDRGLVNHGLLTNINLHLLNGVYHTSVADLSVGEIIEISKNFDLVIMLDQPKKDWPHWKLLQSTYKLMCGLESIGVETLFRTNNNIKQLEFVEKLVTDNPSWCIYPWINLVSKSDQGLNLCVRSDTVIAADRSLESWQNSDIRKQVQQKMLAREKLPESCKICYHYESKGVESYRQYESRDWCNQLDISSISDLDKITTPKYYEVHWSNKCNLKCRSCSPARSSAIEAEFKKHKIPIVEESSRDYPSVDIIDIPNLTRKSRVYVSGGEPVIMEETLEFMKRCIEHGRTDFELTMSTNGVQIPQKFIEYSKQFSSLNLSFSLDGYDQVNDYWRTGAVWSKIVNNMKLMESLGHSITINTVPGIYNVTNLHLLFEWVDREFPHAKMYLQINRYGAQSAYNHPNRQAVIDSMLRCQQTKVYWSDGKSCKTCIDSLLEHYQKSKEFNTADLKKFFEFNDRLDQIRGVKLGDYIPELEACRNLLN